MDYWSVFGIAASIFVAAGVVWFWPHCAKPCLNAFRVRPLAYRIALGLTVITVVVFAADAVAEVLGSAETYEMRRQITMTTLVVYFLVVGLTQWPRYSILLRLRRSPPGDVRSS